MLKVRVDCVVACNDELALIYRQRNGVEYWTLPGGNVGPEEDKVGTL
jgi:ADP-ribose pyrophosphatase YjhB (NUDIX family)